MLNNFPAGLLAIMVSLYLFYCYNNKEKEKRKERKEKLEETRQQFWNSFNKKESKDLSK
jgi:hypothetical protein